MPVRRMTVRREAAELIKAGLSPIEVAKAMAKEVEDLVQLLFWPVGEGELRLSDIYLSIPESRRQQYKETIERHAGKDQSSSEQDCRACGLSVGEFQLYAFSREALHNDMYGYLRDFEVGLHGLVRKVLERAYPLQDDAWWYKGVPVVIRTRCAQTREADSQHLEPYAYTTLINLKEIIDANWATFLPSLPTEAASDKKGFFRKFDRLNDIRNGVMHPIKPIEITEGDFRFVREFRGTFGQRPKPSNLDVAMWMVNKINEDGRLYQRDAAQEIAVLFDPAFVFTNPRGNLAIQAGVLAHFRRMTRNYVVWDRSSYYWRKREPSDPKGKRSVKS